MRVLLSAFLLLCFAVGAVAQTTPPAKSSLAEAEAAFRNKDYAATLTALEKAEKEPGTVNQQLLYLRVMAQHGIVEKMPLNDYPLLMQLKDNSKYYLDNYKELPGNEERYKQVFLVWDKFGKAYPADKEAYDKAVIQAEVRRAELDKARKTREAIREKGLLREEERRIRNEEYQKIRKQRTFGYIALSGGLASPLSSEAKSNITVEEFENSEGGFSQPFKRGKFGLKSGYTIGIHGLAPLDFINRDIQEGSLHPIIGFGISIGCNQAWLRYDWKELDTPENDSYFLFRDAEYGNFSITSFGVGPAFCFRPTPRRMFFDLYVRPEINLISGGRYYVNTTMPSSGTKYEITSERKGKSKAVGTTLGLNFRYKLLTLGAEIRTGLTDDAEFHEASVIKGSTSVSYLSKQSSFTTPGLNLDYASLRFGIAF